MPNPLHQAAPTWRKLLQRNQKQRLLLRRCGLPVIDPIDSY